MSKVETGVMVMKNGKAWGVVYADGHETQYGWINPEDARISRADSLTKPEDLTYKGSYLERELRTGKIVRVTRTTTVVVHEG